jgi:hypothetical protein
MVRVLILAAALLLGSPALAADKWVYEFELGFPLVRSTDSLLLTSCTKVVAVENVQAYALDPRPGWEHSCGNNSPVYNHFLGRRCGKLLPRLVMECGWRHFSSPDDRHEIEYDAIVVRGRFTWGR